MKVQNFLRTEQRVSVDNKFQTPRSPQEKFLASSPCEKNFATSPRDFSFVTSPKSSKRSPKQRDF